MPSNLQQDQNKQQFPYKFTFSFQIPFRNQTKIVSRGFKQLFPLVVRLGWDEKAAFTATRLRGDFRRKKIMNEIRNVVGSQAH